MPSIQLIAAFVILASGAPPIGVPPHGCTGADTAIVAVKPVLQATDASGVATYRVGVTVANVGTAKQAGDTLDSVALYVHGVKTDVKGLQPLAPGAKQTVVFTFRRSADAGVGTTDLHVAVRYTKPNPPGRQDCDPSNDAANVKI